jgi:tRNA modification GTPase
MTDLHDTIVALSTAPGPGGRAIVRLSGPDSLTIVGQVFISPQPVGCDERGATEGLRGASDSPRQRRRQRLEGELRLPGIFSFLPADLYVWPGPRSYTGQDLAELHLLSCPPLVDLLVTALLEAGARAARAGEFTLRAFLSGKLDLARAEAVLGVIEAGSRAELKHALTQMAGGVTRPLQELRDDLLNLLADVEAGLDFSDEDLQFVGQDDLLKRLARGLALVTLVGKQINQRAVSEQPFRVVLGGRPNAGKSSLFNALAGAAALVSEEPGTTRDYLIRSVELEGVLVELVDTAGWRPANGTIEGQAQALGRDQAEQADLVLFCQEAGVPLTEEENHYLDKGDPPVLHVLTKCDAGEVPGAGLPTSAVTGVGLSRLRSLLAEKARAQARPALAPSLSRCRHHVDAALDCLRRAHNAVLFSEPPELLALELRGALDQLGEMVGAVYTDDLLDRIFSRFCIGK